MAIGAIVNWLCSGNILTTKRLILSYIIDWILIIGTAVVGYAFLRIEPNRRPFSLNDLSISFPYAVHETVPITVLILVSVVAPAVIILILTLIFIPGATADSNTPASILWRRRLWEWNAGWMGLGVTLAGVFVCTEGLKDLYGKPRPDMLDRCEPDLSNMAAYAVSGLGLQLKGAPVVVTWEICQNKSSMLRIDGFKSFPSGDSSYSWAGMTYLTIWLCAKFSITFPYLSKHPLSDVVPTAVMRHDPSSSEAAGALRIHASDIERSLSPQARLSIRNQGAAPPVYLLIVALVPLGVATFVSASRWIDHRHHGFDILFGSIMGIIFPFLGFYLYHLPIRRGAGWSWGPRSPRYAFWKGIGYPSRIAADELTSSWEEEAGDGVLQKQSVRHGKWTVLSSSPDEDGRPLASSSEEV